MTLSTVIADTRKAVTDDPAAGQALFSAHGTLTGVTEVDVRTPTHAFTVDEPPTLGGGGARRTRSSTHWPRSDPARPSPTGSGPSTLASRSTGSPSQLKATSTSAAFSGSTTA